MNSNYKKFLTIGLLTLVTFSILPVFLAESIGAVTYTGYVRDRNNRAISGALVRLYSNGYQVSTDYTDSNGYYCVGDFVPTSPYLKIEKTKWVTKTQYVSSRGGTYNFNLYTSACALVVAGSTEERFNRDAYLMYDALIDHYSFSASRIYLITCLSTIDGITIPRDYATSQSNVESACDQIDALTGTNDDVLVYWASHGGQYLWYYRLECGSDYVTRTELDNALDGIPCNKMLVMIGACHSGYFIGGGMDNNANRAILTSSRSTESSWSDGVHSHWNYAIVRALDSNFNADDADDNSNDRVSVWELFDYAYDYVKDLDPFYYQGTNYYQNPQSWVGSSFGNDEYVYIGDQYY